MRAALHYAVLGPLTVTLEDTPVRLGGPRERLMLAALLVNSNRVVGVDTLVDAIWDQDLPARPTPTLQVHMSNLRRRLGDGSPTILTQPPGYILPTTAADVDLLRFEELVALSREQQSLGDLHAALAHLETATKLWRGEALADLEPTEFVQSSRAFLTERWMAVQDDSVALMLELGRSNDALERLGKLLQAHPLRETLWEHRVLALYRLGRQGDALTAYQTCRELLLNELGVDPTPRLRGLETAILRQDPALDEPSTSPVGRVADPRTSPGADQTGSCPTGVAATFVTAKNRAFLLRTDGTLIELDQLVTLGRHPDCDVVFDDPSVSRQHAEIRPAMGGHLLCDLVSSNGTQVGGSNILQHMLQPDDVVQIGNESLQYVWT